MQIEVSIGEIVDKYTILSIKHDKIEDVYKRANVLEELNYIRNKVTTLNIEDTDIEALLTINKLLWDIEDAIRIKEKQKDFGEDFIHLARSVYMNNDRRAIIKKTINLKYGSQFIEEKSFENI